MTVIAELKSKIDRAFEALGSHLRASVDGDDLSIHGLLIVHDNGSLEILDVNEDGPIFVSDEGNLELVASVACVHIAKRIIANAIEG